MATTNLVTFSIDGQPFEAPAGANLLEFAKRNGIYIPHFCYLEGLPAYAGCRMCLVEIEGDREPQTTACTTTIRANMAVRTRSDTLFKLQQGVMGLIISDHPDRCLTCHRVMHCPPDYICLRDVGSPYRCSVCAKNRRCDLQATTEYLKMHEHDMYYQEKRHFYWWKWQQEQQLPIDRANPFLERDYNECIVCARCIRVCDDVRGQGVFDLLYRGPKAQVGTALGLSLHESGCEFCGACVDVCPVNTLMDKRNKWDGPAELQVSTTCSYCSVGCQIQLDIKDDKIQRAIPDPLGPVNGRDVLPGGYGHVCVLGRYGHDYVHSQERLTAPLLRRDGQWVEVSWEEALAYLAERLPRYRSSFAAIAGGQVTNEEAYLLQKLTRAVMGTNHVDHIGRYEQAPSVAALTAALGVGAATNPFSQLQDSQCILAIGTNATVTSPVAALSIRQAVRAGRSLIVIDPRQTELAQIATLWLQPRPGTDTILLAAMARVLLDEQLTDEGFLEAQTEGQEALRDSLDSLSLEQVAEVSGVPAEEIVAAARLYGRQRPAAIVYGLGITQQPQAVEAVRALANLALLTGNLGVPGGGLYPMRTHANTQGATDMGAVPDLLPGYDRLDDAEARQRWAEAWGAPLPAATGLTLPDMMEAAASGSLRALLILGENLALSHPDPQKVREALARAELVVVSDLFLTETAELADLVLPAAAPQEREGTYTNGERRVQRLRQALRPPGDAHSDLWLLSNLLRRLGTPGSDFQHPSQVLEEIARQVPIYAGLSYPRLEAGGLQWPVGADGAETPILFATGFPRRRAVLAPYRDGLQTPTGRNGTFSLVVQRNRYHAHTGDQSRRVPGLVWFYAEDMVEIHPLDALPLGIEEGDRVRLISASGETTARAQLTEEVRPRVVALTLHFPKTSSQLLAGVPLETTTRTPALKGAPVRLERA